MNHIAFIINNDYPIMKIFEIIKNPTDDDIEDLNDICAARSDEYNEHFIVHLSEDQFKMLKEFAGW